MQAHRHEAGHGEEQHHEHTPVIKKVKEKVRRIKDKIKKHGHDNEDEHEESHSYTTEEDYDDEELHIDPAVHGAYPHFHESVGAKNLVGGRDENLGGHGKVSFGEVMAKTTVDQDPSMPKWDQSTLLYPSVAEEQRGKQSHDVVNLGKIEGRVEEDPAAPKVRTGTAASATADQFQPSYRSSVERTDNATSPNVNLEAITGRVEEDPVWGATAEHYTPTYPSPAGGRDDVGESPILTSFKAMAISDKPKSTESTQSTLEKPHEDQPMQESEQEQKPTSSYTEKLSSTATAVKDAAISAAVGSTEYGKKIAHTVYDTVSGVGSKGDTEGEIGQGEEVGETDKGVSIKEYIVGKLSPGEEDRVLSKVLSDTVHTKKQEVVGRRSEEGSGGKGMVEKIKGAVGSWIGAGSRPGDVAGAHEISGGEKEATTYASAQKDLKQ